MGSSISSSSAAAASRVAKSSSSVRPSPVENENRQTLSRTQKISTNLPSSELVTSLLQKSNLLLSDQGSDRQIKFVEQTLSKVRTFWRKWQKEVYSRGRLRGYRDGRVVQQEKLLNFNWNDRFLRKISLWSCVQMWPTEESSESCAESAHERHNTMTGLLAHYQVDIDALNMWKMLQ